MPVLVKRAYDKPSASDGVRVLVERAWPRGLGKSAAKLDLWLPELAPSEALSKSFESKRPFSAIQKMYFAELSTPEAISALERLHTYAAGRKRLTLLYAGKNSDHNAAIMLKQLIDGDRKPPTGSGPGRAAAAGGVRAIRKGK